MSVASMRAGIADRCLSAADRINEGLDPREPCGPLFLAAYESMDAQTRALRRAIEWMEESGCECGHADPPGTCPLCEAKAVVERAEGRAA